jgi:prepilin-type N-terminal cleavage/methylation domain-containing protein
MSSGNTVKLRTSLPPGFTLVELAVVIVVIGALAAFGMPRFINSVERSKASEAFGYLEAVRGAQDRYFAREGTYALNIEKLDLQNNGLKYFNAGPIRVTDDDSWSMTLTRVGASAGYGAYTITFNQDGYDSTHSTIESCPTINPNGSSLADPSDAAEPN